nr:MAG: hypothetical protein [Molluscum contagiosum virus]
MRQCLSISMAPLATWKSASPPMDLRMAAAQDIYSVSKETALPSSMFRFFSSARNTRG